ncbi:hypothetical protein [Ekhidna lutea]|nr:hypothetical protein [Ekhidna lutea]
MNNKKHLFALTVLTFLIFINSGFSQRNYVRMDEIQGVPMTITYNLNPNEKNIDGTPFLFEEWKEVKIERVDGLNLLAPEAKYHVESEDLIAKIDDTQFLVDNKRQIKYFYIDDRKFLGSSFGQGYFGFFEVLVDTDKVIFLKKHICRVNRGKPSNGIIKATNDEYKWDVEYYVKKVEENSKPLGLKVNKKSIILKSNKYPELANYLNKIKGKFNDEENLIKVFEEFK